MRNYFAWSAVALTLLAALSGCTVHSPGEQAEGHVALDAGTPFDKPTGERSAPPLPENPAPDNLVR